MFKAIRDAFQREAQSWESVEVQVKHKTERGETYAHVRDGYGYDAVYDADIPEGTYTIRKSDWAKVAFHEGGDRGAQSASRGDKAGYKLKLDFSERE